MHHDEAASTRRSRLALAGLLGGAGVLHVVTPGPFDAIVPRVLPGPARGWTYASAVVELTCAALVARRSTARVGAGLAAATFVLVFPANVQGALDHRTWSAAGVALWARLPLQAPLVVWALRVARRA